MRAYAYEALCNQVSTLVIFDEIHHAGDTRSWGDGILQGFSEASIIRNGTIVESGSLK